MTKYTFLNKKSGNSRTDWTEICYGVLRNETMSIFNIYFHKSTDS